MMKKKIKVIACKVMLRQLYRLAAESSNTVDILWMEQELHTRPEAMRAWLQSTIDRIEAEEGPFDAIALAYGLCSNGTVGLRAKKTPLVIARAHDCITLLLGSRQRYADLFAENNGGMYWYSQGWMESALLPGRERYAALFQEYTAKYGEDNAEYLMRMEQSWMQNYHKAIYIRWPGESGLDEQKVSEEAEFLRWEFQRAEGDVSLLRGLLDGPWDVRDYLVVSPGHPVAASHDESILKAGIADA